jgi:type II secretory pathway component PulF
MEKTTVSVFFKYMYLLTAAGLSPGGSTHLLTNNTQNNTNNNRTTQITNNVEECRACPVFASFTLAFALQLRKKHGKTTVRFF